MIREVTGDHLNAGNTYTQHGADLPAFMEALTLEDAILVAHS